MKHKTIKIGYKNYEFKKIDRDFENDHLLVINPADIHIGKYAKELWIEAPSAKMYPRLTNKMIEEGRHHLQMNGREVFKQAVRRFPEVITECLEHNGLQSKDISLFLPHQANIRINSMVQQKMGFRDDQVLNNIHKYGNTTSATIPILLTEAYNDGKIKEGDLVLMAAFGSGFTWGASLVKW